MTRINNRPKSGCSVVNSGTVWLSCGNHSRAIHLAAEAKDALDVAGEAALSLLLYLVIQGREGYMVESEVKEQGLAGDWLEVGRELDQVGLLSYEGRVQAEGFQAVAEGLHDRERSEKSDAYIIG